MNIARKVIPVVIASFMALAPALPAFAALEGLRERLQQQKANVQERLQQRRENIQEKRENIQERRENIQEKREAAKEKREVAKQRLAEKRKQNIRAFFGRMAKRLEAALDRQAKLGERIQSRIEKAKANGKDITNAQAALDKAKAAWQEAKAGLDAAKAKLDGALAADDPKTAFEEVKSLVGAARDKIKAVHVAYTEAITALKGLGQGAVQESNPSPAP